MNGASQNGFDKHVSFKPEQQSELEHRRSWSIGVLPEYQPPHHSSRRKSHSVGEDSVYFEDENAFIPFFTCSGTALTGPKTSMSFSGSNVTFLRSVRFRICLLLCGAMFMMSFMNLTLGMAIICMTSDVTAIGTASANGSNNDSLSELELSGVNETTSGCCSLKIDWSKPIQGLVLSAISWGRLVTPVAGVLCDKFNAKAIIAIGLVIACVSTALIPVGASYSFFIVLFLRFTTGFCDAAIQPSMNKFICLWFPLQERNLALSIATAGRQLAILVVFPFTGFLCLHGEWLGGWPVVFYSTCAFVAVWTPMWVFCSSQNPKKNKKVQKTLEILDIQANSSVVTRIKPIIPWHDILTSRVVWVDIFAILCHEIPFNVMFIFLPAYIKEALNLTYMINGVVSTVPALAFLITKLITGNLSGFLENRFPGSKTKLAKILNTAACVPMGAFLIATSQVCSCHPILSMAFLTLAIGSGGIHTGGCLGTVVSIAPRFAGTIAGLTFFTIGTSSLLSPVVVRALVPSGADSEWSRVFIGIGIVALLPVIFFNVWGSASEQPWAVPSSGARKHAAAQLHRAKSSPAGVGTKK